MTHDKNRAEADRVIAQAKKELRSLFVKSEDQIKKVGNALKKVVKKEESICEEIKIALKEEIAEGVISTRTIELHCPPEWKRKTKPKQRENEKISFSKPQQQQQIAATQEGKSVIVNEPCNDTEPVSERIGTHDNSEVQPHATNQIKSDEPTPCPKSDNFDDPSLLAINNLAQNKTGKRIESDLEKCPNCSVLRLHNQELEEALREATTMSTAERLHSTSNEASEILNLEYSLPYQYIQQYMAAEYKEGKSKVWFSVEIDVKSKKVVSAKTGRISESQANWIHDIN
ncbi:MAG: hypothetical protein WA364_00920 [Candidatus Nitrosopolaris sp.]